MISALPVQSLHDFARLAQQRLHPDVWNYLAEGDSGAEQHALGTLRIVPRPLQDVRGGHSRLTLFGQTFEHPVLLAPIAYQRLFHADGECASAMAASAQGTQMILSSLASQPFSAIAKSSEQTGAGRPWFQLYWQGNRAKTLSLLQRALDAGCSVVVFTVDAPIKVASLQLPQQVQAVNLEPDEAPAAGANAVFDGWMAQAPTWDDLDWLRAQTKLPLLLKGVLHPDDAVRALDIGCDGIVVSTHGGRVLKNAVPSLFALMRIAERVAGRAPLLFDSGIRSGQDVYAALACGASAVLLGRPYIWGLAAEGALGVARVIRLLRDELEMTMALTGCATLSDIDHNSIVSLGSALAPAEHNALSARLRS